MIDRIEIRPALMASPKVYHAARVLRGDESFRSWAAEQGRQQTHELVARAVVSTLMLVWAHARTLAPDGVFRAATIEEIDRLAGMPGFGRAMQAVGWLQVTLDGIELPNFGEHNPPPKLGKKRKRPKPTARAAESDPGFARFWAVYPRKQGKAKALAAWHKHQPDAALLERILQAVARQKQWQQWRDGFIPFPATWLNQERWDDEELALPQEARSDPVAYRQQILDQQRRQQAAREAFRRESNRATAAQPDSRASGPGQSPAG